MPGNYRKRKSFTGMFRGFIYKLVFLCVIVSVVYAVYLFALMERFPEMEDRISAIHSVVAGKQARKVKTKKQKQKKNVDQVRITGHTTEKQIEKFISSNRENIEKELEEMSEYKEFLEGRGMEIIKKMSGFFSEGKEKAEITQEQVEKIKVMIEDILEAYGYEGEEEKE